MDKGGRYGLDEMYQIGMSWHQHGRTVYSEWRDWLKACMLAKYGHFKTPNVTIIVKETILSWTL